jgi:hypothetical protein
MYNIKPYIFFVYFFAWAVKSLLHPTALKSKMQAATELI